MATSIADLGAESARQHRDFGAGSPAVWASYWFVTRKGEYRHEGYTVTADDLAEFKRMLNVIAKGIGDGVFPANPGSPDTRSGGSINCTFCPFDRICPKDRQRAWQRKQDLPAVAEYLSLANGAVLDDTD